MSAGLSRRVVLRAAAALIAARPFAACAQTGGTGCCIVADASALYRLPGAANRPPATLSQDDILDMISTDSGVSRAFERQLGPVLGGMARIFGERPGFGFYDDGGAPNAWAFDTTAIERTAGTVAFGREMLTKQLAEDGAGVSVAAICAHEFAHILQFRSHWRYRLLRAYPAYAVELHADYLAGFYLRWLQEERAVSLQGVGRAWEEMGPSEFTEAATHGTAAMRLDTIQRGHADADRFGRDGVAQAAAEGFAYIATHARRGSLAAHAHG